MNQFKLISSWLPVLAGLTVLLLGFQAGFFAGLLVCLPAVLMIIGGGRLLLSPDLRGPQHVAMGAALGIVLSVPAIFAASFLLAAVIIGLSCAAFLASGWFQIRMQPRLEDVPSPSPSLMYSALVGVDNLMLGPFALMTMLPGKNELHQVISESETAHQVFADRGWLDNPETYHRKPPAIDSANLKSINLHGVECEIMEFDSGFEPHQDVPGRERWLDHSENRTAYALLLRHHKPGPWLIGIHGFGMGHFKQDFQAFRAGHYYRQGLNVALITLPVHGNRAGKGMSGGKFFGASALDPIHAESQAIWDIRRLIGWIRQQGGSEIGVHGISLGGYTTALLAGLEKDLACLIAGVPPSDLLHNGIFMASTIERRIPATAGADPERDRALHRVISPLCFSPEAEHGRRYIYAATGDQFVPIEEVHSLWLHWQRPRISWCTGGHVSALMQKAPRALIDEAVTKWLVARPA